MSRRKLTDECRDPSIERERYRKYKNRARGESAYKKRATEQLLAKYKARRFVGIDSEGRNIGRSKPDDLGVEHLQYAIPGTKMEAAAGLIRGTFHNHKTFLWGAGDSSEYCALGHAEKRPLSTVEILDWLTSLPEVFGRNVIYISFAFSYDATQIAAGLTYEQALRLHENARSYTRVGDYCLRYLKGKHFTVGRLRDPNHPRKNKLNGDIGGWDFSGKVTIHDTFGFFQSSFVSAIKGAPGCATDEELEIIQHGKDARNNFAAIPLARLREYNALELKLLTRLLDGLRDTCLTLNLRLHRWSGAGSIASALLQREGARQHYPVVAAADLPEEQTWAMHAFFGGRIEQFQYGFTKKPLHVYDINSAYPDAQSRLSSMAGGSWRVVSRPLPPTRLPSGGERKALRLLESMNGLSLVQLNWFATREHPIGPFPYRTSQGMIYWPPIGRGIYNIIEVLSALRLVAGGVLPYCIEVERVLEFVPARSEKPFANFQTLYDERRELVRLHREGAPYNMAEKVIKLALNASYGKMAQRVGGIPGVKPPAWANPWYAAAITAHCRARMLAAAAQAPDKIVQISTDGIISTVPLDLDISKDKELGKWEYTRYPGGAFVLAGVYGLLDKNGAWPLLKARGYGRADRRQPLIEKCVEGWQKGATHIDFEETRYMTLGASTATDSRFAYCGHWVDMERRVSIVGGSPKRVIAGAGKPATKLCPTRPAPVPDKELLTTDRSIRGRADTSGMELSRPRMPEWVVAADGAEFEWVVDSNETEAGLG